MTPVYLNPPPLSSFPVVKVKEEQQQHLQLFLSQHDHGANSLSCPTFLNPTQDQSGSKLGMSHQVLDHHYYQKVHKYISHGGSIDDQGVMLSSASFKPEMVNDTSDAHKLYKKDDRDCEGSSSDGSFKWMPSKMRLMRGMANSSSSTDQKPMKFTLKFQDQQYHVNSSSNCSNDNNVRVCADCNTTTTPLWRSGPRGPKSLCNACGIRQRKARRAMMAAEAAANGTATAMETSKTNKMHNKEKKLRTSRLNQCKKLCKPPPENRKEIYFKNLAINLTKNSAIQQVFPQDVEEAAILLMELSCGFIHT